VSKQVERDINGLAVFDQETKDLNVIAKQPKETAINIRLTKNKKFFGFLKCWLTK
jgi:hypothetical protein